MKLVSDGIPCWCQFHSSSSMLRSFALPQRGRKTKKAAAGPQRERGRQKERDRERERRGVKEIIEVQVQDKIEKKEQSDRFANIL